MTLSCEVLCEAGIPYLKLEISNLVQQLGHRRLDVGDLLRLLGSPLL